MPFHVDKSRPSADMRVQMRAIKGCIDTKHLGSVFGYIGGVMMRSGFRVCIW